MYDTHRQWTHPKHYYRNRQHHNKQRLRHHHQKNKAHERNTLKIMHQVSRKANQMQISKFSFSLNFIMLFLWMFDLHSLFCQLFQLNKKEEINVFHLIILFLFNCVNDSLAEEIVVVVSSLRKIK